MNSIGRTVYTESLVSITEFEHGKNHVIENGRTHESSTGEGNIMQSKTVRGGATNIIPQSGNKEFKMGLKDLVLLFP